MQLGALHTRAGLAAGVVLLGLFVFMGGYDSDSRASRTVITMEI